jgi:hypothetical protein
MRGNEPIGLNRTDVYVPGECSDGLVGEIADDEGFVRGAEDVAEAAAVRLDQLVGEEGSVREPVPEDLAFEDDNVLARDDPSFGLCDCGRAGADLRDRAAG